MNKLIMVIGLTGSGKRTWVKQFTSASQEKWEVIYYTSISIERNETVELFATSEERKLKLGRILKRLGTEGSNIILVSTNNRSKERKQLIDIIKQYKYMVYGEIIPTTVGQCIENSKMDFDDFEDVIMEEYHNYQPPHYFEGFNRIEVNYPFIKPFIYYKDKLKKLKKIPHDNHWHNQTIGVHMDIAAKLFQKDLKSGKVQIFGNNNPLEDYYKKVVLDSIKLHDIGKPIVKTFTDPDGHSTEEAHYYNHWCVGAYEYLFYLIDHDYFNPLEPEYDSNVAAAIAYHMRPAHWTEDSTKEKYKKLWGPRLYRVVELVSYYDKKAQEN